MITKYAKLHSSIGMALIVVSLGVLMFAKPTLAPEFSGETEMVIALTESTQAEIVQANLATSEYPTTIVGTGTEYTLTTVYLNDEDYLAFTASVEGAIGEYSVLSYQSFSPSISKELIRKSLLALVFATIIIILFISYAFRRVSRPVDSYKYGVVSIVALLHDISIPLGVFALIASYTTAVIDTLFVTAMLATIGYSINDTIVIFDRVRERLGDNEEKKKKEDFGDVIEYGVRASIRRSVYTSLSTALPLILLIAFVPVTKWFAVALLVGITAGTYSSLFFAPSLLLLWHTYFPQKARKQKVMNQVEQAEERLRERLQEMDTL